MTTTTDTDAIIAAAYAARDELADATLDELFDEIIRLRLALAAREKEATHDPMTGLLNRRGLFEAVAASSTARFVSLIDLDGLKTINDTQGHTAGDARLSWVAERIAFAAAQAGGVAARIGGDEFVIVSESIPWLSHCDDMASMGTVDHLGTLDESILRADALMYENKRARALARA